jgi:hypothetical protein
MSFSLLRFGLNEMLSCGADLRRAALGATSIEEVADSVVRYFYAQALGEDGKRECVMARFYMTVPFASLQPDSRQFAARFLGDQPAGPELQCLTLLGTVGDEPGWNSRWTSHGHHAIPLPTVEFVKSAPMIAELVRSVGLDAADLVSPRPEVLRAAQGKTYNVFYVRDADGSQYIPAQDFVSRYGVRSVLGFGGVLLTGEFYSVILFTRVSIPPETADRFRNIALDLKLGVSAAPIQGTFIQDERPRPIEILKDA